MNKNKILDSCTIVPDNLYIERAADRQIRQIIAGMGRPGYVLVARQMGKTNLLLHTRKLLEKEREIFTFIDFSIIGGYTETECFNHLIDETINLHPQLLSEAEIEIDKLRSKPNYTGYKMFTRELRIILKYVDKLVFILDEIDALARTDYSDRVFSSIRTHYFQRDNYEELNKLTYILSGVIEPKDIIKDPNISPFNIGEKIYMNDFTQDEFDLFIEKAGLKDTCPVSLHQRIYYWTKGNPRITWDVCALLEEKCIKTEHELDQIIRDYYINTFDKAPIDAIRQKVKEDEELKDALVQLYFNKGEALSAEVRSRLYLAGIIEFDNNIPQIKNPILEQCLSYDWVMSLQSKKTDYLTEADRAIWMQRDYKKAITYLNHYLEEKPSNNDDIDKAYYLLGEAYYRSYNAEYTESSVEPVISRGIRSKYFYQSLLVLAQVTLTTKEYDTALKYFNQIISANSVSDELLLKAKLGKIGVLLNKNDHTMLDDAERAVTEIIEVQITETFSLNVLSLCQYYLGCINEQRGDNPKAVTYLDFALTSAQQNEMQFLLYKKISLVGNEDKKIVAEELYKSLSKIENKPENEDFDNPLAFNKIIACQIISYLILNFPEYDVVKYIHLFLFDSKESAVFYIDTVLHQVEDEMAPAFFEYIKSLYKNESWHFEDEQVANIALMDLNRNGNAELAYQYISRIKNNPVRDISIKGVEILLSLARLSLSERRWNDAADYYNFFNDNITNFRGVTLGQRLLFDYYYAWNLVNKDPMRFRSFGANLLKKATEYRDSYKTKKGDRLDIQSIDTIIENIVKWMSQTATNMRQLGLENHNIDVSRLGRNSVVEIRYLTEAVSKEVKYKQCKDDVEKGLCEILRVVKM